MSEPKTMRELAEKLTYSITRNEIELDSLALVDRVETFLEKVADEARMSAIEECRSLVQYHAGSGNIENFNYLDEKLEALTEVKR